MQKKSLIFDASSVITLGLNNLLYLLPELKEKFKGEFLLSPQVKKEVIDAPLQSKRFKLQALQINKYINNGTLKVYDNPLKGKVRDILNLCNMIYRADTYIKILDLGEVESLVLCSELNGSYVVDERTMRMLVEDPEGLRELLQSKLHKNVFVNEDSLNEFKRKIKEVNIIRSSELGYIAYLLGMLKDLGSEKTILDGLLWGLKLRGCAISQEEIKKLEGKV